MELTLYMSQQTKNDSRPHFLLAGKNYRCLPNKFTIETWGNVWIKKKLFFYSFLALSHIKRCFSAWTEVGCNLHSLLNYFHHSCLTPYSVSEIEGNIIRWIQNLTRLKLIFEKSLGSIQRMKKLRMFESLSRCSLLWKLGTFDWIGVSLTYQGVLSDHSEAASEMQKCYSGVLQCYNLRSEDDSGYLWVTRASSTNIAVKAEKHMNCCRVSGWGVA